MKYILIIICCLISGCADLGVVNEPNFLPPDMQQTVMIQSDIYQITPQGLRFHGHFTPLEKIYSDQQKIWENGGSGWDVNGFVYSKHSNSFYFTSPPIEQPNTKNPNSFISMSHSNLYRLSLVTGKTKIVGKNLSGTIEVSPNGRFLALEVGNPPYSVYSSFAIVDTTNDSIKIIKQDIQLTRFLWLSDHELLIYAYEGNDKHSLSILDINTLQKRNFRDVYTALPYYDYIPLSVSPSGDKILFDLDSKLFGCGLWMLNIRQNTITKLLADRTMYVNFKILYWLPNSTGFLFCKRNFNVLIGDLEVGSNTIHYYSFIDQREKQVSDSISSRKNIIVIPNTNYDLIKN